MRILSITFQNLNSLKGEWCVDLNGEALGTGIFAIVGPTGAGKSTLLDALCLGLFGCTPRLNRVTQSENEIMTKQTGSCYAEVLFETSGQRFVARWSQRRARYKPGGRLQSPTHTLDSLDHDSTEEERIALNSLSKVAPKIEQLTGLNFTQFTRSMLLAQGEFAAFLKEDAKARALSLERITGTEIYGELSSLTYDTAATHQRRLEEHKARYEATLQGLFSQEEEERRTERLKALVEVQKEREAKLHHVEAALTLLARFESFEKHCLQVAPLAQELAKKWEAMSPEFQRLERSLEARPLYQCHTEVLQLEEQAKTLAQKRDSCAEALQLIQAQVALKQQEREAAQEQLSAHQKKTRHLAKVWEQTKDLDRSIAHLTAQHKERESQIQRRRDLLQPLAKELKSKEGELRDTKEGLSGLRERHKKTALPPEILEDLPILEERIQTKIQRERECKILEQEIQKTQEQHTQHTKDLRKVEANLGAAQAHLTELQKELQGLQNSQLRLLGKRPLQKVQKEQAQLLLQRRELERAQKLLEEQESGTGTLVSLTERRSKKRILERQLKEKEQLDLDTLKAAEASLERQRKARLHLQTALSLEGARQELVQGAPCPLCGSRDHPYVTDHPQLFATEEALEKAKKICKTNQEILETTRRERADAAQELALIAKERELLQNQLRQGEEELGVLSQAVGRPLKALSMVKTLQQDVALQLATLESLLTQVAALEEQHSKGLEQRRLAQEALHQAQSQLERLQGTLEQIESSLITRQEKLLQVHQEEETALQDVQALLLRFGRQPPYSPVDEEQVLLRERIAAQTTLEGAIEKKRAKYALLEQERSSLQKHLKEGEEEQGIQEAALQELLTTIASQKVERYALLGEGDPHQLEAQAQKQEVLLQRAWNNATEHALQSRKEEALLQQQSEHLATEYRHTLKLHKERSRLLKEALAQSSFHFLSELVPALLDPQVEQELLNKRQELGELEQQLKGRQAALKEEEEQLQDQSRPPDPDALRAAQVRLKRDLNSLHEERGALREELQRQSEAKIRQRELVNERHKLLKEAQKWDRLNDIIGSKSGRKFRDFAQSLTFAHLIARANEHLVRLQPRYRLVPREGAPLQLDVEDIYQAGKRRASENLSGGETFIASLSLALGLASMVSKNVVIGSLFLDEGFATLDEETLETALSTLSSLDSENRLIGIISHHVALKETIARQIQVIPLGNGYSTLKGPGVTSLS